MRIEDLSIHEMPCELRHSTRTIWRYYAARLIPTVQFGENILPRTMRLADFKTLENKGRK